MTTVTFAATGDGTRLVLSERYASPEPLEAAIAGMGAMAGEQFDQLEALLRTPGLARLHACTRRIGSKASPIAPRNRASESTKASVSANTPVRIAPEPERRWASPSQALQELRLVGFFKARTSCMATPPSLPAS